MTPDQLTVAEALEHIDRNPAAVRHVLGSRRDGLELSVEQVVEELLALGYAAPVDDYGSARLTGAGVAKLKEAQAWSFKVSTEFVIEARAARFITGRVLTGCIRVGDRFSHRPSGAVGRIEALEWIYHSGPEPEESIALRIKADNTKFMPGDILTSHQLPLAG
jgi:hypothetical protein